MVHDVFVSYSTIDHNLICSIVDSIEANNIKCWYCERDIEKVSPDSWRKQVVRSITTARIFMLVLSNNANNSKWVHQEVSVADTKKKGILVMRVENVTPDDDILLIINGITWQDIFCSDSEESRSKLIKTIKDVIFTGDRSYVPTVQEFCDHCRQERYYDAICMPSFATKDELRAKIKKFEEVHKLERLKWRLPMASTKKFFFDTIADVDLEPSIDLMKMSPPDPEARYKAESMVFQAFILEDQGQIEKAMDLCEKAIKTDPSCWWGYHKRAWLSLMFSDYMIYLDRVIEDSKIALSAKPDGEDDPKDQERPGSRSKPIFGSILNDIGRAYDRKKDLEKARAIYMQCIEVYPELTIAMLNLMSVEIRARMFSNAISTYDRFVKPRLTQEHKMREYWLIGDYLLCTAFALEGEDYSDCMEALNDPFIVIRSNDIWNNDGMDGFIDALDKEGYYPDRISNAKELQALFKSHYSLKVKKGYDHDVYIAYSRDNETGQFGLQAVEAIVSALESAGIKCWYADRDFDRERQDSLLLVSEVIFMSRLFLLVLSDSSNRSEWIAGEMDYAKLKQKDILVARLEDVRPSETIATYCGPDAIVDALDYDTNEGVDRVVNAVKKALERPNIEEVQSLAKPINKNISS
jgi:tetratricopeptide (TPR) repeat protein